MLGIVDAFTHVTSSRRTRTTMRRMKSQHLRNVEHQRRRYRVTVNDIAVKLTSFVLEQKAESDDDEEVKPVPKKRGPPKKRVRTLFLSTVCL